MKQIKERLMRTWLKTKRGNKPVCDISSPKSVSGDKRMLNAFEIGRADSKTKSCVWNITKKETQQQNKLMKMFLKKKSQRISKEAEKREKREKENQEKRLLWTANDNYQLKKCCL